MYNSPTYGQIDELTLQERVSHYMNEQKEKNYRIIVGTDSQKTKGSQYDFVVAIAIHRVGAGGIYFWQRDIVSKKMTLKERMYAEALRSLESAETIFSLFRTNGISKYNIEIHVDIGRNGETRNMIAEIVGMVRGSGYDVKIKPESFGASKVADRHT